jgi:hypothetical protein
MGKILSKIASVNTDGVLIAKGGRRLFAVPYGHEEEEMQTMGCRPWNPAWMKKSTTV